MGVLLIYLATIVSMRKYDTCFFERYAQITLEAVLGEKYASLVNEDRPDLQMPDGSLGIEVTRAMEPHKEAALTMLKEMAGLQVAETDREDMGRIVESGYGYGLQDGRYVGHLEYEYWSLAQPLRRIIESKVSKVGSGFYGDFHEYGLYIFCKDDLSEEEVGLVVEYTADLQRHLDVRYSKMYLSMIDKLYVCDLSAAFVSDGIATFVSYDISRQMCKDFFLKALRQGE
jgi:hypothetical protein